MSVTDSLVRAPSDRLVRRLAWATLVANTVIVLTGGAVRLTASGLGCPTWPRCTDQSFVPHGELGWHGVIEFGNRLLTYVLVAIAVATWLAIWRRRPAERRLRALATVLALGIPLQAVIGGITVLTDLNPWIVSLHLLLSLGLVAGSTVLIAWIDEAPGPRRWVLGGMLPRLVVGAYVVLGVALYLGTVVTGSGPHAGDLDAPRNGLDPAYWSRLHALSVWALVAITVVTVALLRRARLDAHPAVDGAYRAAVVLLLVELAQGAIGYVQYATDLPWVLVLFHLGGAAVLVWAGTRLVLAAREPAPTR